MAERARPSLKALRPAATPRRSSPRFPRTARPLRRQAAYRPLRCLPAPDGLLGRDHAGRLLPDRRRWLEGRDLPRIIEKDKKGKEKDKGWTCDLSPSPYRRPLLAKEQAAIDQLAAELETVTAKLAELEEEHGGEEGAFAELDKVNKANVSARLKEIKGDKEAKDEARCSMSG